MTHMLENQIDMAGPQMQSESKDQAFFDFGAPSDIKKFKESTNSRKVINEQNLAISYQHQANEDSHFLHR